jgi:hypothetical protein
MPGMARLRLLLAPSGAAADADASANTAAPQSPAHNANFLIVFALPHAGFITGSSLYHCEISGNSRPMIGVGIE